MIRTPNVWGSRELPSVPVRIPRRTNGNDPKYMTIDEAEQYCGIEPREILQYLEDGTLTSHQTEDGMRVTRSEVKETCDRPAGEPQRRIVVGA